MIFNLFRPWVCVFFVLLSNTSLHSQNWSPVAELPDGHLTNHAFGFAVEGTGYLIAGQTPDGFTNAVYSYDPLANAWSSLSDFPGEPRGYTIGDVWDGIAWMGFGLNDDGAMNDLWRFDPATGDWTEMASCPCEPRYHPAFVAHEGHIYMGMGSSFGGDLGDWWDYDMATDTWTEKPSIPAPERHHPYQFGIDGVIYTGFGHNGPDIYNTWYAYDPSDESWEEVASLPDQGRVAGTQFAHGGLGFALSGDGESHSSMDLGEFWAYDPEADSWTEWPAHPGMSRWAPASFVIEDDVYLIQGMSYDPGTFEYMETNWKFALVPEVAQDVALESFVGGELICGSGPSSIVAEVRNLGAESPTDLTLEMRVNGQAVLSSNWTGSLAPYQTTLVVLGTYDLNGIESFELAIVEDDDNPANNLIAVEPEQPTEGYVTCEVTVVTDNWGNETSWEILSDNAVVASGSGYDDNAMYTIDVTLPGEGCYELVLNDSYGDGMVGQGPNGAGLFKLRTFVEPGNPFTAFDLFAYDGSYEFSQVTETFAVVSSTSASDELALEEGLRVFPNPTRETLTLTWPNTLAPMAVDILSVDGQTAWRQDTPQGSRAELDTQGWKAGVYLVQVRTEKGLHTTRVVKL